MGGVTGDFAELKKLKRMLALAGVDKQIAKLSAKPLSGEAARTFDAGQDPYGAGWPATKTQGARRLNDSGALRAGATGLTASGKKIKATVPHYARYQRPPLFIPSAGRPPKWVDIVEAQVEPAIKKAAGL